MNKSLCWLFGALGLVMGLLPSIVMSEVELPGGEYYLDIDDLKVKALGGYITVQRTWYKGQWHFNRAWADPELEIDAFDGSIKSITRNGDLFALNKTLTGQFIFDERRSIVLGADGGYRWQDRRGNWIDYDVNARILGYGDRNDIGVSFIYNAQGRRTGVLDHLGTQLLWYEYDLGDDRITAVRDATTPTPRRVQYIYQGVQLYQVIDAANNTWTYEYNVDGTRLERVSDPDGRPLNISYYDTGRVKTAKRTDGTGPFYSYDYDSTAEEYYTSTTQSSGKLDESWYDRDGEVTRRDLNGITVYTMHKDGRKRISEDELGNITIRQYDQWDNLIHVTNPDRSTRSYSNDSSFTVTLQEVDERKVITKNEYDTKGNRIRKTEALGLPEERVSEFDYDVYGNLWKQRVLADAVTQLAETVFTYDSFGNIDTMTDPEGHITDYLLYDAMGNPLEWTDGRGKLWKRSYDGKGRLLTETNPLLYETSYQYDGFGNRTHVTDAELNTTETRFDINNRREAVIDALTNQRTFTYNSAGQLAQITDEEGKKTRFTYDVLNRLKEQIDGAGNVIRYHYGEAGSGANYKQTSKVDYPTYSEMRQYDQRGRSTSLIRRTVDNGDFVTLYGYDLVGNQTSIKDEEQRDTLNEYDALSRLVKTINPLTDMVVYGYDDRDNLLSVTNERDVIIRSFSYDGNNRKKSETWPTSEAWGYDYDATGNLNFQQDGKGQVTRYFYDDAGRNERSEYYADIVATTPQKTVNYGHNKLGNVTSFNDGSISGIISYDELLRKTGETINYGPFSKSYQNGYFKNGERSSFTDPELRKTEFGYDLASRLSTVKLPGTTGTIVYADYQWSKPGRIIYPGGTQRQLAYDDLLRITDIDVADPAGNPLMDYHYAYDRVGNIKDKITEHGTYSYGYDGLDRLTSALNPTLTDEGYEYDSTGNRILSSDVAGAWTYNDSNQLKVYGDTFLNYDSNGSTILKDNAQGKTGFEYNLENRLTRVIDKVSSSEVANYHYDPFGRRVWKDVGGVRTYFLYADEGLIAEYDATGNEIRGYVHEPSAMWGTAPIYLREGSNSGFYQLDHLGTPQKVVAAEGNVLWAGESKAFGEVTERVSVVENPLRFPGQYYDGEVGQHYNYFRDYEPEIGRYVQSDPIGLQGGINTYRYSSGNPITRLDPSGLAAVSVDFCELFPILCDIDDLPGEGLAPPGDCSGGQYEALRSKQEKWCGKPRRCQGITDCYLLRERLSNGQGCANARWAVMRNCFRGGDARHFFPLQEVFKNIATCYDQLDIENCDPNSPFCEIDP